MDNSRIKKNKQKKVIVTLTTKFEYPVSVLPSPKFDTAVQKAFQELTERHKCLSLNQADYTSSVEETEGFTFKEIPDDSIRSGNSRYIETINFNIAVKALSNNEFERAHGSLNPSQNPGIFVFRDDILNEKGEVIEEAGEPYLRPEYADIYFEIERRYTRILNPPQQ